MHAAVITGYP